MSASVTLVCKKKQPKARIQTQLLLPTIYSLNKSFSKKIYMRLEVNDGGCPQIDSRLIGADFAGVVFTDYHWDEFVSTFDFIKKIFSSQNNKMIMDQKLMESGFNVRFVISHGCRAVEIESILVDA